ncbi:hypothetical protein PVK06_041285 [Gossypium arboreum]|uniref:Dirigent protein n=1 Tax=Gossypium arboreum TaxID=29729 RepID=A0ABR0N8P3_GOSAR|nr:hypothetical protein PVK06_041285 [Gossypium arboreum]
MASFAAQTLFIFFFTLFFIKINGEFSRQSINMSKKNMEKITCLHFYFHNIIDGKHTTAMQIIRLPNKIATSFGTTFMVDDLLTEKPKPLQNLWEELKGFMLSLLKGIYNGSAISILGRNAVLDTVTEMPIVGGSKICRFARGYALAKTVWPNKNEDAIVEYNVTVVHL